jgi:hypothetical protein
MPDSPIGTATALGETCAELDDLESGLNALFAVEVVTETMDAVDLDALAAGAPPGRRSTTTSFAGCSAGRRGGCSVDSWPAMPSAAGSRA